MRVMTVRIQSQLRRFIIENQFSRFSQLLKQRIGRFDVEFDDNGCQETLLCLAVERGSRSFVHALLYDAAVDVNHAALGRSPLLRALERIPFDFGLIQLVIEAGVDLNFNPTDLIAAVQTRNDDVVRLLIEKRNIDRRIVNINNGMPLLLATSHDCSDMAMMLLRAGANPRVHNRDNGKTPLHHAVRFNDVELTRLLIESGALVNVQSSNGQTPLLVAAEGRSPAIVALLVRAGADVNHLDPLSIAARRRTDSSILRELIRCGADVNESGALTTAVAHKAIDSIELLLALGEPYDVCTLDSAMRWWSFDAQVSTLLFAAGATDQIRFEAASLEPQIAIAKRNIAIRGIEFVRSQAFAICVALQALALPALVTLEIVDQSILYANKIKMHVKWNWIVAIKHAVK